jgi:hypothetical protein
MTPVINTVNQYLAGLQTLYRLIGDLKSLRSRLELHGLPNLTDEQYTELTAGAEMAHLSKAKIERLFAAMTTLDTALGTPVSLSGVTMPPAKAIVDVLK